MMLSRSADGLVRIRKATPGSSRYGFCSGPEVISLTPALQYSARPQPEPVSKLTG